MAVRPLLMARMTELAALAGAGGFDEFFDYTMRAHFISSLGKIGAHEGTVWLLDETRSCLIPRFNNGPKAANFVGRYRQNLRAGMISMVVSTEQPICENEVYQNQQQDKTLDRTLGLLTCAMVATPLYFAGELRGVISAVQLKEASSPQADPPGFTAEHLEAWQLTASILARLVDRLLLASALDLEDFT
jgi:hypothetical protein